MSAPTLGYQDDCTISKQEIARLQLVEAIDSFLNGKYICSVTLAGAAEGVLAGLLEARGKPSAVEESVSQASAVQKIIGLKGVDLKKDTEHYAVWNKSRNAVKHHKKAEAEQVTFNQFDEAYWMIERALRNAELLAVPISNLDDYRNWIIVNVNM
jgi:hypothetical protein